MNLPRLQSPVKAILSWQHILTKFFLLLGCLFLLSMPSALAGITDDSFEGNVFVLYGGGNSSFLSRKIPLEKSLKQEDKATLLIFYVDDSRDCKQYSFVVTRLQGFYSRAVDFIPINVDTIPTKSSYTPTEPGYYYKGVVPQVVVFNQAGEVVLNQKGQVPFEQVDDTLREVFNLLPRSESLELKRRPVS
jgi:hypothetical protein